MKNVVAVLCMASFAAGLSAQVSPNPRVHMFPTREGFDQSAREDFILGPHFSRGNNPTYQGGPVLVQAKVVFIFWGPSFANVASPDYQYAQQLQAFRNQYGTNGEYNVITQYYQIVNGSKQYIQLSNLGAGTPDMFDTSTPPTNVTDGDVQNEVANYLSTYAFNASTIYEVVIPSTSYSSYGNEDSCGGPNLYYCAYHSSYTSGSNNVIYSIEPYPSCSGCQWSGWTNAQNADHFVCHETREAVTDPLGNAWWNTRTGNELDDQCAWSPSPFLSGGYGYQYEWSNASGGCVKTR
ncbi:MAG: hypothetical protein JOZ15_14185 [Acidobacteria bacterium]|nr:hypothetical protein [Acidobacteriota bacterium]